MTSPIRFPPFQVRSRNYMRPLVHIPRYFILHPFCIRLNSSRLLTTLDWELCSAFFLNSTCTINLIIFRPTHKRTKPIIIFSFHINCSELDIIT